MTTDPRETLAKSPMSRLQVGAVAITVGLNALDGFDVLSISFASPGIAREWGIDRAALGFVLMMELLGMGLGSVLLGGVADRIGRRWMLLGCLAVMTGGMLAATNAVAAEFSNSRRRGLCVSLMALAKINRSLARMGHAVVNALPTLSVETRERSVTDIFSANLVRVTALMTLAYFLHITTFYFILKWVPKIVVDMGFTPSAAAGVLVWANVGGATGGAVLGLLSLRFGLKHLTMFVLGMSTLMVAVFGRGQATLAQLSLVCAMTGLFTNAGVVGLYGIMAQVFPTHVRATGTGFTIGIGRAGSMLAPIIAGFLFRAGYDLEFVAVTMGVGSPVAAVALWMLPLRSEAAG
jgi:MFS family permease